MQQNTSQWPGSGKRLAVKEIDVSLYSESHVSRVSGFLTSFFSGALCPQKNNAADEKGKKATAIILNLYPKN